MEEAGIVVRVVERVGIPLLGDVDEPEKTSLRITKVYNASLYAILTTKIIPHTGCQQSKGIICSMPGA